ncbi:MAG TPA: porin [Terriglobia bacterium]|nr:porin [Terriglobia bacterium]
MKFYWRIVKIVLVSGILAGPGGIHQARGQEAGGAAASGNEAQRIAVLEEKLRAMEQRLQYLESKLNGGSAIRAAAAESPLPIAQPPQSRSAGAAAIPTPAPAPQPPAAVATVSADPQGFAIQSPERDFLLRIRYQMHLDGRFAVNRNERAEPNTFYLRRTQPILTGTLYRRFSFQVLTEFAQGRVRVNDAYVDTTIASGLVVRGGKFKGPVGLERLRSGMALPLHERALPTRLVPNRDLGVQLFGNLAQAKISYAVGVFNGLPDGASGDGENDDLSEFNGRLMFQPFAGPSPRALAGLSFGIGGSYGHAQGNAESSNLPVYESTGGFDFFQYHEAVFADGVHYRLAPQGYWYAGPFGLMAEYTQSVQEVRRGSSQATMNHRAWQWMGSYVLTGDPGSFEGVAPERPFDPSNGGWGAFEFVARIARLQIDREAFPFYADPAESAREATAWAVGLNWYLNRNVKLVLGYEQTAFESAAPGVRLDTEKLFQQRFQLRF